MTNDNNYQPQIIWQGEPVGIFDSPQPDMWYLEGPWISNETDIAFLFKSAVEKLDLKSVYNTLEGVEAFLEFEGSDKQVRIIVIGLIEENILFVRRMPS
ncbi:hypothetical protein [Hymenobacter terricola]|uniref:hypothetical protein n=1 Tax=Hymenobacter terricola TaxID=2819236 RepID=UPI001B300630|nr:hypothetical protein [Hymenobacter terricola]